ncbi:MAG: hypothetical protein KatS3mg030_390 [Saprospiraceae bacterium]|nr:MAG: hypothetical protein KatS3mg030_390 [Saprospiraceae bacterium]
MEPREPSYYVVLKNPVWQAVVVLVMVLAVDVVVELVSLSGVVVEQRFPWTISSTFILFFILLNVLSSFLSTRANLEKYWTRSMLSFVGLAILSFFFARLFSKLSMGEAGSYRWIFIVLTIGYIVFILIMGAMRKIVEFAMREEWNQPRLRQKKKRKKGW